MASELRQQVRFLAHEDQKPPLGIRVGAEAKQSLHGGDSSPRRGQRIARAADVAERAADVPHRLALAVQPLRRLARAQPTRHDSVRLQVERQGGRMVAGIISGIAEPVEEVDLEQPRFLGMRRTPAN